MKLTPDLIKECIAYAEDILHSSYPEFDPPSITNISISKARSYWAQINHVKDDQFEIRVSNVFDMIESSEICRNRLTSCMIHELIHTQNDCWNHGKTFKSIANKVNSKYPQFNISTRTSMSEYNIPECARRIRYTVRCATCGYTTHYLRKPKIWSYINEDIIPYECSKCGNSKFTGIDHVHTI